MFIRVLSLFVVLVVSVFDSCCYILLVCCNGVSRIVLLCGFIYYYLVSYLGCVGICFIITRKMTDRNL